MAVTSFEEGGLAPSAETLSLHASPVFDIIFVSSINKPLLLPYEPLDPLARSSSFTRYPLLKCRSFLCHFASLPAYSATHGVNLHNHLSNTLATKGLATNKGLTLETSKTVADSSENEEYGSGDQAAGACKETDPLDGAHDEVGGGSHVVGRDLANRGIELR